MYPHPSPPDQPTTFSSSRPSFYCSINLNSIPRRSKFRAAPRKNLRSRLDTLDILRRRQLIIRDQVFIEVQQIAVEICGAALGHKAVDNDGAVVACY